MSLNHSPSIVTNGLILHLDAASSKSYPRTGSLWKDLSPYKNIATIGTPVFNTSNYGNFLFSGNYGSIPWNAAFPSGNSPRTLFCTFKATQSQQGEVFGMGNNTVPGGGKRFGIWCDTTIGLGIEFLGIGLQTVQWPGINNWCHFCAVVPVGSTLCSQTKLYINGKNIIPSVNGTGTTLLNTVADQVRIAAIPSAEGAAPFRGNIANIQLYNIALSDSEILQNFNAIKGRFNL